MHEFRSLPAILIFLIGCFMCLPLECTLGIALRKKRCLNLTARLSSELTTNDGGTRTRISLLGRKEMTTSTPSGPCTIRSSSSIFECVFGKPLTRSLFLETFSIEHMPGGGCSCAFLKVKNFHPSGREFASFLPPASNSPGRCVSFGVLPSPHLLRHRCAIQRLGHDGPTASYSRLPHHSTPRASTGCYRALLVGWGDRKSTRLNSSHT